MNKGKENANTLNRRAFGDRIPAVEGLRSVMWL
jgi:hypothetical protein